ncbi:biotin--[acetyl-CoA-carboxylase] ligase [Stieleria sp. TO1_6]|uniref:biotin--[acetyl-CoA-carboxylase] ligase n=1 Tax=Stieleria tagensis TaxID=2956795 RepID=UPI00209A888A|nr:biotin--[acetyl-CoA-carboxylase] ligase [Stieleria tagensis]MCO8122639.1 biotin--[acetyl-CoA-carboxylase] ligase [Stieleria tagensis]
MGDVSPLQRQSLSELIESGLLGSAHYSETTGSTNSDALQDLQSGHIPDDQLPRLYLTDRQTAGRGRQGNVWKSVGDSLTMSLVTTTEMTLPGWAFLSPGVGVAVARAIEYVCAPCRVGLKWPNDICALVMSPGGSEWVPRKLGGILIETAAAIPERTVIGIGLNLSQTPQLDGTDQSAHPISLVELTSRAVQPADVLVAVIESLVESITSLSQRPHEVLAEYRSRCVLSGKSLSLKQNDQLIHGVCCGISDDGSLELFIDGQRRSFRSGEVRRVRSI